MTTVSPECVRAPVPVVLLTEPSAELLARILARNGMKRVDIDPNTGRTKFALRKLRLSKALRPFGIDIDVKEGCFSLVHLDTRKPLSFIQRGQLGRHLPLIVLLPNEKRALEKIFDHLLEIFSFSYDKTRPSTAAEFRTATHELLDRVSGTPGRLVINGTALSGLTEILGRILAANPEGLSNGKLTAYLTWLGITKARNIAFHVAKTLSELRDKLKQAGSEIIIPDGRDTKIIALSGDHLSLLQSSITRFGPGG